MPAFVSCPASDALGRQNLQRSVVEGVKYRALIPHLNPGDGDFLETMLEPLRVWGFRTGSRNTKVWEQIKPGDVALFYQAGAYRYHAPVQFKWIDPSGLPLKAHEGLGNEAFPLKFVVGDLAECYPSISDYNDLLGYKPTYLPADPRVVDGDGAAAVLSAILGRDIDDDEFPLILDDEGRRKYRRHLAVERSASNRQKVLAAKGYVCEACGFNFQAVYGPSIGHYAEVHHLRPLSLGPQTLLTIADFAVLCANCHRAIHRPIPTQQLSLSDLKSKISTH